MKKTIVALYAVTVLAFAFGSVLSQPPGEKDKGSKKDKKGPQSFQLGKVLPPFVRDGLDLTKDQEKAIAELEKEVRGRLLNILTAEQVERLKQLKDPKGPPKNKGGDPPPAPQGAR